jgi:uncharacterized protein (TIGR02996 family)
MDTLLLPNAFYLVLDETPADRTTLCALADWLEEEGDLPSASCVRWTIRRGLHPIRFSRANSWRAAVQGSSWHDGWYWWAIDEPNWVEEKPCRLPPALWNRLDHSFPYVPGFFKEYPTRRAAYEALFEAWPLFAPSDRVARKWEGAR